jgi:hypothetical protein
MFRKICFSKIIITAGKKKNFPETTRPNNLIVSMTKIIDRRYIMAELILNAESF